jgi:hypothetical protein
MATPSPLERAVSFWRPLVDREELADVARYSRPEEKRRQGINVWLAETDARFYTVVEGETEYSLFAAVYPIETIPASAVSLAEIRGPSGRGYSHVLWFPGERSVVVPFDPNIAVDGFHRELYVAPGKRTVLPPPLLPLYYSTVKPLLGSRLKGSLRRLGVRRALQSNYGIKWPWDQSLDLLQRLMLRVLLVALDRREVEFVWFWPDEHSWAAVLTHDVETAEGVNGVGHIAKIESERGFASSFNFVSVDYDVSDSFLLGLRDDGFEIGVHGHTHDGLMFSKRSTFLERVGVVNEVGRRWGAAGFRSPATYRNQSWFDQLEFEYDSSVSNSAPLEPQPGGCASSFPYVVEGLVELPITLPQDHTLFAILGHSGPETWLSVAEQIRASNGVACVLTHPDPEYGYIGNADNHRYYERLLDMIAESGAWAPLPRELVRWWRARAETPIATPEDLRGVSRGVASLDPEGRLRILAPGSESLS